MINSLFTFDLDSVLFHLLAGVVLYLFIQILGISVLNLFKKNFNPLFIYPFGLSLYTLIVIFFLSLKIDVIYFIILNFILFFINKKIIFSELIKNLKEKVYILVIIFSLVIVNSTTIHDPDSQNGIQSYGDSIFYIMGIFADFKYYKFNDLSFYDTPRYIFQQIGIFLAFPFKNFYIFKPILNFTITCWILSLMYVYDIFRYNLQQKFINYFTLIFTIIIFFSFRTDFYLDESLPTILTIPLIFLFCYLIFDKFDNANIYFEISLLLTLCFLSLITKQVLILLVLPIFIFRIVNSKNIRIIKIMTMIIIIITIIFFSFYFENFSKNLALISLNKPYFFQSLDQNLFRSGFDNLNKIVQLYIFLLIGILSYKSFKLLSFSIIGITAFVFTSAGGPFLFWTLLFLIYSNIKYVKSDYLNRKVKTEFIILILFFLYPISFYLFGTYHFKIGVYFLFFIFFFTILNLKNFSNTIKILVILISISFPVTFSKKIPSVMNFLIRTPLENGPNYSIVNKIIKNDVPINSIIFTDLAKGPKINYFDNEIYKFNSRYPNINYLTISGRQFYILSSYFGYNQEIYYVNKFLKMYDNNSKVIYGNKNPKDFIKDKNYNNFYILIKKNDLNKVKKNFKDIKNIENKYFLIKI